MEGLGPEEQYLLIRELLAPEFGSLYVTLPVWMSGPNLKLYHLRSNHEAVFPEKEEI